MDTKKQEKNIKSKEIKNKKLEIETKKLDKKTFKRINEQFRQYWRYLFGLIFIYIISYAVWVLVISGGVRNLLNSRGLNPGKKFPLVVLGAGIITGLLFTMDGFVTALLKSPFNQMCIEFQGVEINFDAMHGEE